MRWNSASKAAFGATLLAVLLAAGGCKRKEAPANTTSPAATQATTGSANPAQAAAPFQYKSRGEGAEVTLTLPTGVAAEPDLHARLYSDGVRDLKRFAEGAKADRAEMGVEGGEGPLYAREIDWSVAAETPKLLSLQKVDYEFSGGAHPNSEYSGLLWDKALKKAVAPAALFKAGTSFGRLDAVLCDGLKTAKKAKLKTAYNPEDTSWTCPKWTSSSFVLAPSTVTGKAGGLIFLFSPCAEGPCAEGQYAVTVPLSAFASALSPAYADDFAGQPAKLAPVKTAEANPAGAPKAP